MSYYIDEHHEIYVYWKNSIYDNLYFCVCFMCFVGVQQWADAILTAILGPYLTCMNKHKFTTNTKVNLSPEFIWSHVSVFEKHMETWGYYDRLSHKPMNGKHECKSHNTTTNLSNLNVCVSSTYGFLDLLNTALTATLTW